MRLTVLRTPSCGPRDESVIGQLRIDGTTFCVTLERESTLTPAGIYTLDYTVSQRVLDGELWSPDPDHRLLLVCGIPGRSGVRIHSANLPEELDGCTAVGRAATNGSLLKSRDALTALMSVVVPQIGQSGAGVTVEYCSPNT